MINIDMELNLLSLDFYIKVEKNEKLNRRF